MSTKIVEAVMHCTGSEPVKIIDLGIKLRDNLYTASVLAGTPPVATLLYPAPPVTLLVFKGLVDAAVTAQGKVKGGGAGATTTRDTAVSALFVAIGKLLLYANGLYKGIKADLIVSGFDVSADPSPHVIPDAPVIKSVKDGKLPHSAKIMLAKITSTLSTQKESYTYTVQMALVADLEANYRQVLQIKDSRKLVIAGLTRGAEVFFRICRSNAAGQSDWSEVVPFMPQ